MTAKKGLVGLAQVALLIGLAAFWATSAHAQGPTTAITGTVIDPQGRPVVGASVTVTDAAAAITRQTQTDNDGLYQVLSLKPGTYVVRVEAKGFRTAVTDPTEALVSTTKRIDIKLEVGAVTETVTVTEAAAAVINTTDATLGNAFDSKQILALPFEGRDAAGVLSLQPGVSYIPLPTDINPNVDTRNGALNGGRGDQANITLDGVDNNTQTTGTAFRGAVRSTLDSIEEFRVTTAGDNADQGRSSGGQVALVTKGGTNNFHGSLYEQYRPTNTVANEYFNKLTQLQSGEPNIPAKELRNTFGGSLGGPILKDRLFFFYTYEGQRQAESTNVTRNVPSTTLRDGVVIYPCAATATQTAAQVCPSSTVAGESGTVYNVAAGRFGVGPAQIKQMDPNCAALGTCPLGNGPDPAVLAIFQKYPAPNATSCANFDGVGFNIGCNSFSAATPLRLNTNIARIDYNIDKAGQHRLFLRGNYQVDSQSFAPQFSGSAPNDLARNTSRALAVGYTAVFSSTLVNSFHYGLTRQSQSDQGLIAQQQTDIRFIDSFVPVTSTTTAFHVPVHNWLDDVSWTRGKHTLQFGTNIRLIGNSRQSNATSFNNGLVNPAFLNVSPAGSGGSLDPGAFGFPEVDQNFANIYNNAIVDLVGIVDQVTGNYNRTKTGSVLPQGAFVQRHFRSWEYDWYAQDTWHPKSNLTVTAGLRYTILEPPYETTGTQAAPNISLNAFVNQRAAAMEQGQSFAPPFSFDLSGQANGKAPYWPYDYKDLGPRLSIAYSPGWTDGLLKTVFGGPGKSSIRAGFGIVYDHFGEALVNTFDQNGTFGLSTSIGNPASIQTVDGGARYTGPHDIPTSSTDGVLLTPAPAGGFPATPPTSVLGSPVQQIAWGLDDKIRTPYSELVDLVVSRELPAGLTFQAAYVGRFAHRLLQQRDLAMPLNLTDPKSGMTYFQAAKTFALDKIAGTNVANIPKIAFWEDLFPAAAGKVNNGPFSCGAGAPGQGAVANPTATQAMYELFFCNSGNGTLGETNALNILDSFCFPACLNQQVGQAPAAPGLPGGPFQLYNPQFSALYAWSSIGKSNYNAAQFSLRSQPKHGVQFDFNYTYSASFDYGSDAERAVTFGGFNSSSIVNTWNPRQNYGPSDFDTRHAINFNFVADAPFGRGKRFGSNWNRFVDTLIGGWQLVGLGRWSSGLPWSAANGAFNFPTNFQLPGDGVLLGPAPKSGVFPGSSGTPSVFADSTAAAAEFRLPFVGETGQRNNLRGPGFFSTDLGVNKMFRLTEGKTLRFSAYAYNFTNSVRFDSQNINNNIADSASFGVFGKALTTERRMEFALRFEF